MSNFNTFFHKVTKELSYPYPGELYHYTNSTGLLGILDSKKLYLTDASYLNDPDEINHGYTNSRLIIREELFNIRKLFRKQDVTYKILDGINKKLTKYQTELHKNYHYIGSFCEKGDLLSQWRAYSNYGKGFSIKFKTDPLSFVPSINLLKVIYEDSKKKEIIKKIVEHIKKNPEFIKEKDLADKYLILFNLLSFCFKSDFFKEEKEWRLIYSEQSFIQRTMDLKVELRPKPVGLIPYVEMPLSEKLDEILGIIVGPSLDYKLNKKAIESIPEYSHINILKSSNNLQTN